MNDLSDLATFTEGDRYSILDTTQLCTVDSYLKAYSSFPFHELTR